MSGRSILLSIAAGAVLVCGASAQASKVPDRWLDAALEAGRWLRSVAIETEAGVGWRADPAQEGSLARNLYAGSAGIVCFLIELARVSEDDGWLALAGRAGDELLERPTQQEMGLWTGLAGEIFALERLWRANGEERFHAGVLGGLAALHDAAKSVEEEASFGPLTDVIAGDAGIGFLLLHTARALERPEDLELATRLGRRLLAVAEPTEAGLDWPMQPGEERHMPGFSHGTAGIATFLCELSRASGQSVFLDAASAGARELLARARSSEGALAVAHHFPGGEELYYLGWCHGPAGTERLFGSLFRASKDERWSDSREQFVLTLLESGLPAARPDGYWNNVGQCCGAAGIVHVLLAEPADRREALATALGEDLLTRARRSESGLAWPQAEHRVQPDAIAAQTGYMQGAAGVGMALLELHAHARGAPLGLSFPDDRR